VHGAFINLLVSDDSLSKGHVSRDLCDISSSSAKTRSFLAETGSGGYAKDPNFAWQLTQTLLDRSVEECLRKGLQERRAAA
jgi:hypothetical protein